ncbi:MAG: thioredoxin family protein [Microcystaceae cyanobacterium]
MSNSINVKPLRNGLLALVAIALGIALFLGIQTQGTAVSLDSQAKNATPFEVAMSNHKPTLTEFYADWCTSCQAMAADLAEIKSEYQNSVNFVMLNVDNSQWLPEILRYRVDGIPHFVFLNDEGNAIAQSIGEQPKSIIKANLDALIAQKTLPYAATTGQTSIFKAPLSGANSDPRSHGAQTQ